MATVRDIGLNDQVELLEPEDDVPVGATGSVLEFRDDGGVAMVEITSMPAEPILERIAFVPLAKLRRTSSETL
jgi:hypothetical protein